MRKTIFFSIVASVLSISLVGSIYASAHSKASVKLEPINLASAELTSEFEQVLADRLSDPIGSDKNNLYKAWDKEMAARERYLDQVREALGDVPPDNLDISQFISRLDVIFDES
jgi:hypothetical protein